LRRVKAIGKCRGTSSLKFLPSGDSAACGPTGAVTVKLKKKGKKAGKCKIVAMAASTDKPKKVDKDILTLVCSPPAAQTCATTTCTPSGNVTCEPLVSDGKGITGTYQLLAVPRPKLSQSNATQNRFGRCNTDADCGGGQDNCSITPFATADGVVLPFPQGIKTTKTGDTSDPGPDCQYGTADDPPAKPCNTSDSGAGHDLKGKVARCVGNGSCDGNGIQYRVAVPSLSSTWQDLQSPQGTCIQG